MTDEEKLTRLDDAHASLQKAMARMHTLLPYLPRTKDINDLWDAMKKTQEAMDLIFGVEIAVKVFDEDGNRRCRFKDGMRETPANGR